MTDLIRTQLTLFINKSDSACLEEIRRQYNPVQYALIDAHVTLCREHEMERVNVDLLSAFTGISIGFGKPVRFAGGKGVLLPATDDREFRQLREWILPGERDVQEPHITLMHPRNATCTDEIFGRIRHTDFPERLTFHTISMIEQIKGRKWQTMRTWPA